MTPGKLVGLFELPNELAKICVQLFKAGDCGAENGRVLVLGNVPKPQDYLRAILFVRDKTHFGEDGVDLIREPAQSLELRSQGCGFRTAGRRGRILAIRVKATQGQALGSGVIVFIAPRLTR
ncbi:hypothetical protein [Arthrobacter sp. UYCu723]